jgi:hypothetical protein
MSNTKAKTPSTMVKSPLAFGLAIFVNTSETDKGNLRPYFKIDKSFKRKGGTEYEKTDYLYPEDLAMLQTLIPDALRAAGELVASNKKTTTTNGVAADTTEFDNDELPI